MLVLKKIIKCFIPYGFLVLRRKLLQRNLVNKKFMEIKRDIKTNYFCNTTIKICGEGLAISREDYKHPIYLRNNSSDVYVYRDIIENDEYNFTVKNEPEYIIDAGANIGLAAIYFANKYKNTKIIAIEPEESNFELLQRNIRNYTNIIAIKAALWNSSGEITLFDTGLGHWGFMTETTGAALNTVTKNIKHLTEAVTVEDIIRKFSINSIDIIKMDIEGSEKEVFESCANWIGKTKCVIVELHERMKKGCSKSFYKNIKSFDQIGVYREDIYAAKNNYIKMI